MREGDQTSCYKYPVLYTEEYFSTIVSFDLRSVRRTISLKTNSAAAQILICYSEDSRCTPGSALKPYCHLEICQEPVLTAMSTSHYVVNCLFLRILYSQFTGGIQKRCIISSFNSSTRSGKSYGLVVRQNAESMKVKKYKNFIEFIIIKNMAFLIYI